MVGACGGSSSAAQAVPSYPQGPLAPLEVAALHLNPGEYLRWELSWKGVKGGHTQMIVGEPGTIDGHPALLVTSETESEGVVEMVRHIRDQLTTAIALDSGAPISHTGIFEFGSQGHIKGSKVETAFKADHYEVEYKRHGETARRWVQHLPPGNVTHDTHSAIGALRAWTPEPGARGYLFALSGRRVYRVEVSFTRRERIETVLGEFDTIRLEGVAVRLDRRLRPDPSKPPRQFTLWLSDDEERMPLLLTARTELGSVRAELSQYKPGKRPPIARGQ